LGFKGIISPALRGCRLLKKIRIGASVESSDECEKDVLTFTTYARSTFSVMFKQTDSSATFGVPAMRLCSALLRTRNIMTQNDEWV